MKQGWWMVAVAFALFAETSAQGQNLGLSPVGSVRRYGYPMPVNHAPSAVVQHRPTGVRYVTSNRSPTTHRHQTHGHQPHQAYSASTWGYNQAGQQQFSAPTTPMHVPRDAYWAKSRDGRTTYFRPGHPLGNLMRAFGYSGPSLTP